MAATFAILPLLALVVAFDMFCRGLYVRYVAISHPKYSPPHNYPYSRLFEPVMAPLKQVALRPVLTV